MAAMNTGYGPAANRGGYSSIPQPGNPARSEAWALIEAARRMSVACERLPKTKEEVAQVPLKEKQELLDAVRLNWKLWTLFQASWSLEDCPLPLDVRQNLFSLANFVDKQTVGILKEVDPVLVKSLVDVNRTLAGGLMDGANRAAEQSPVDQPVADVIAPRPVIESA